MKKLMSVIIIVLLLTLVYTYNNTRNTVVTVEVESDGPYKTEKIQVINTLHVFRGDTIFLEKHSFERRGNRGMVMTPLSNCVVHYSYKFGISTYYRMITEKEAVELKPVKIEWVMRGTPSDSLIKSNSIEYSYPSIVETISIKKGIVIKRRA